MNFWFIFIYGIIVGVIGTWLQIKHQDHYRKRLDDRIKEIEQELENNLNSN